MAAELSRNTVLAVQKRLNRLDMAVLGYLSAECSIDEPFYSQVLLAMAPEHDAQRLGYFDSLDLLIRITDNLEEEL